MAPIRFKILNKPSLLLMAVVTAAVSALFTITYLGLVGVHAVLEESLSLGADMDVVVIHSSTATTPFTGLIPADVIAKAGRLRGVKLLSPEVLLPVLANGSVAVLRGVEPRAFMEFLGAEIVEGRWLDPSGLLDVCVGSRVAARLGVRAGDVLVVKPSLSGDLALLRVSCVLRSGTGVDDELLANLELAGSLRGVRNAITVLRIKYDPQTTNPEEVAGRLGVPTKAATLRGKASQLLSRMAVLAVAERARLALPSVSERVDYYLSKYGASHESLVALAVTVLALTSWSVAVACLAVVEQHSYVARLLRRAGLSAMGFKALLLLPVLVATLAGALVGVLVGRLAVGWATRNLGLLVAGYSLPTETSLGLLAVPVIVATIMAACATMASRVGEEP